MSETLNLNTYNFGMWAEYRKKCKNKKESESHYCVKLYQILFSKS
jgi:hypothetical protein